MQRLWTPWRLAYVTGGTVGDGCVFCRAAETDDPLVVHRGTAAFVILNLFPYNNGHVMVVPYRHVAAFALLTPEELQELALLTQRAEIALYEAYRPQGLNVGVNLGRPAGAGVLEHLHVHLVPRWTGDTNFMTITGDTRVLPEDLPASAARLRPIFARLAEP